MAVAPFDFFIDKKVNNNTFLLKIQILIIGLIRFTGSTRVKGRNLFPAGG